jgi:hypothetical protein
VADSKDASFFLELKTMLRPLVPTLTAAVALISSIACISEGVEIETGNVVGPRALGTLTMIESEEPCLGTRCISFVVTCPELGEPTRGRMIIEEPDVAVRGTIAMFSGGVGQGFTPTNATRDDGTVPEFRRLLNEVRDSGFRLVQVMWDEGWTTGSPESDEGLGKLACRPATATAWIADNLTDEGTPLCAGGGSGGAAQVSYMLSHYGLDERLSLAVPYSGNWMGHIDIGCLDDDPINRDFHYSDRAREFMDVSMGYPGGEGPCTNRDESARAAFEDASIAGGGNDYVHPNTMVWIILGGADQVGALPQGHAYYERLAREGSPLLRIDILSGVPHGVNRVSEGADRIRDAFLRECRLRTGVQ